MRNYTSKSQKAEMYSKKYHKSEEEMFRILTEHEALLTFDELKIRYDNPELGKLPEWLEKEGGYEALQKYIEIGVNKKYGMKYSTWIGKEDLISYMWEFVLKRVHLYETPAHIISSIANRMVWLWREHFGRGGYIGMSLQDVCGTNEDEGTICTYEDLMPSDINKDQKEVMELIDSIKDIDTKAVVISIAYLVVGLEFLAPEFNKVFETLDESAKNNISELILNLQENEDKYMEASEQPNSKVRKSKKLSPNDIVKALKYNIKVLDKTGENMIRERISPSQAVEELRDYLVNTELCTYPVHKSKNKGSRKRNYYTRDVEETQASEVVVSNLSDRPDLQNKYRYEQVGENCKWVSI